LKAKNVTLEEDAAMVREVRNETAEDGAEMPVKTGQKPREGENLKP
jgi:hypothetical protein